MNSSDVVVVGAGVFGAWTAHHLREAGARVSMIDAYGVAHARASSGDHSRILRCGYGPDAIYAHMAWRSLRQWQALQARLGPDWPPIWHRSGVLWLTSSDDAYAAATRKTLLECGLPMESLDRDQLRARFPQLDAADLSDALFEPDAGVLTARRAVRVLVDELVRGGVHLGQARVLPPQGSRIDAVVLADGTTMRADRFVFACGAWLPTVFPELLRGRIRPTRQTVVYFRPPSDTDTFGSARTPAWIDFPAGIYGVPDVERQGVKVGIDEHGPAIDPDTDDRVADPSLIRRARAWLERRFPLMKNAAVAEARVCQYENTSNGDFLIDRHPAHENVWIVGGGSGHGFKHGPAVGEEAARLVLVKDAVAQPRFALAGKGTDAQRAVY
jgi:glycine/D-amino acid oxidase-like deaminating enzyme